jgi:hypothetical protein
MQNVCEKTLYIEEKIPYQATIMKWKGVGLHYCYNAKLLSRFLALIEPPFVDCYLLFLYFYVVGS